MNLPIDAAVTPFVKLLSLRGSREVTSVKFELPPSAWPDGPRDYNLTQVFRTPIANDLTVENARRAYTEHMRGVEYSLLFGRRYQCDYRRVYETFTGGVTWWAPHYRLGDAFGDAEWETALRWGKGGRHGTRIKYLLAPKATLNRYFPGRDDAGQCWHPAEGRMHLLETPALELAPRETMIVVDMNHLRAAYLRKRKTKLLLRDLPNGEREGEWLSDVGLDIDIPHAHSVWERR